MITRRVAFVTILIPDYKVWMYRALDACEEFELLVIHGPARPGSVPHDAGRIGLKNEWLVDTRFWSFGRVEITWIPALIWLLRRRPRVLVLQDGVRIVSNIAMHFVSRLIGTRVFYYSHGFNHQGDTSRPRTLARWTERLRRAVLRSADGVLVYSSGGRNYLRARGVNVPITVVGNSIDAGAALARAGSVSRDEIEEYRRALGLEPETRLIVNIGRLVAEKQHDLFIEIIRRLGLDDSRKVHGVIAGDGPLRGQLEVQAENVDVTLMGHLTSLELSRLLACADLVFQPGTVGLAIVEAFCSNTPFAAIDRPDHGPEIELLNDKVNGFLIKNGTAEQITNEVAGILDDSQGLAEVSRTAAALAHTELNGTTIVDRFKSALTEV